MSDRYARIINQYRFRYQTVIPARFGKHVEDGQVLDEIEQNINLNFNQKTTQSCIDIIDIRFH